MADNFAVISMTLPTDVGTDQSFDAPYPPGTDASAYDTANTAGVVVIIDDSDRYSGDQVEIAYGASATVTNKTEVVWRAGQTAMVQLPKVPFYADTTDEIDKSTAVVNAGMAIQPLDTMAVSGEDPAAAVPVIVAKVNELIAAYQAVPPA